MFGSKKYQKFGIVSFKGEILKMNEVRIVNLKQVHMYVKNGLQPLRVEVTDRLVFIFDREEATDYYRKWCNYELK